MILHLLKSSNLTFSLTSPIFGLASSAPVVDLTLISISSSAPFQRMNDKAVGGLKVIGIGLPRTGTSSIQAALAILDVGPVHHMTVRASSNLGRVISARDIRLSLYFWG